MKMDEELAPLALPRYVANMVVIFFGNTQD
jgi:hypothetical protein